MMLRPSSCHALETTMSYTFPYTTLFRSKQEMTMLGRTTQIARLLLSVLTVASLGSLAGASASSWTREDAVHLIRRAGFGGTPEQIDRVHALGKAAAVDFLLTGKLPGGAEAPFAAVELADFKIETPEGTDQKSRMRRTRMEINRLRTWWLDRMARTDRPLEEKMSLFWHGLLTSGVMEVRDIDMMTQQNDLFHDHAMGN